MSTVHPRTVLWLADRVVPARPDADAMVTEDDRVLWVGTASSLDAAADGTIDLRGTVITPAFVDAHVHATATGLALDGLDLHGATSLSDALDRLARHASSRPGEVLRGTGWDESTWPERRSPTAAELDRATDGAVVYLARADVHGAVASSALLARCDLSDVDGVVGDGLVRLDAHHVVRREVNAALTPAETARAQRRTLAEAARLGVGAIHEMAGPEIGGLGDLESLLALAAAQPTIDVFAYWGAIGDLETPRRLGLVGAGGDLFCDGSIGSHTAALHAPYADAATSGVLRFDLDELVEHIALTVSAGLQSGFHVIGDAAVDQVLTAYEQVAARVGTDAVREGRHRLEHVEMASADAVSRMAALGLTASVQPAFDAAWGGPDLMYVDRLGRERGTALNPYSAMSRAGVLLALGSDAPVTAIDPWGAIRAAVHHRTPASAISARVAFAAATVGGHAAVGRVGGQLLAGGRATFASWESRSADAATWDLLDDDTAPGRLPAETPVCLRTVVGGRTVYDLTGAVG
ncbi:MAG TPA: amidohydrolase [Mycobacteriales bacterium]|nr:amidohydrolase [Mycobacteriales bacterium]